MTHFDRNRTFEKKGQKDIWKAKNSENTSIAAAILIG